MFTQTLAGLSLLVSVSVHPGLMAPDGDRAAASLSAREKTALLHPLISSVTDCVAQAVAAHPRIGEEDITNLIVESFMGCVEPVQVMIDAHDRYYGAGSGDEFFMGPYLDALPATVLGIVGGQAR